MTKLTKTIKRELIASPDFLGRPMMVELQVGDSLSFRLKGKKTRYEVSLHKVFLVALMQKLNDEYKAKLDTYNQKKAAGYKRLRKPRKPSQAFFSRQLKEVLSINLKIQL